MKRCFEIKLLFETFGNKIARTIIRAKVFLDMKESGFFGIWPSWEYKEAVIWRCL
jgi:hypothetical protein